MPKRKSFTTNQVMELEELGTRALTRLKEFVPDTNVSTFLATIASKSELFIPHVRCRPPVTRSAGVDCVGQPARRPGKQAGKQANRQPRGKQASIQGLPCMSFVSFLHLLHCLTHGITFSDQRLSRGLVGLGRLVEGQNFCQRKHDRDEGHAHDRECVPLAPCSCGCCRDLPRVTVWAAHGSVQQARMPG